ncbi:hypothetical protein FZO89_00260 [Luteimonas viscosa]|uniref:Uncharacterized protein n=1 Tax=Luteimonas viscosa TaxID=1132694 RepID=A0A5D4XJJ5_9GAMM|nr:hypothetical protein [Luteimonas viscosa]TYT24837.1 hypothetical protein FZO89_00260 [Luteimonas viscosa]
MNKESQVHRELEHWATARGLMCESFERWDAHIIRALFQDSGGDIYEFWAAADESSGANVGACLVKRGGKKYRALHRERERFSHVEHVPAGPIAAALESCLDQVHQWVSAAGHQPVVSTAGA